MATSGHGHDEPFVPSGPTHNLGYEPDTFGVKTILAVPAAVIITAVVAFVITWVLFANIFDPRINNPEPIIQVAADRGNAPLNDRIGRISSTDPNAEIDEPRLEGIKKTEVIFRDGNEKNNKDINNMITAEMTPTKPLPVGNSPMYHPEDLRADRWAELNGYGQNKETGTARIPVDKAIELLLKGDLKLPSQKDAKKQPIALAPDRPKESNGGQGVMPANAPVPPVEKKEEKK